MTEEQAVYAPSGHARNEWMSLSLDAREMAEAVIFWMEENCFSLCMAMSDLRNRSLFYEMRTGVGRTIEDKLKEKEE